MRLTRAGDAPRSIGTSAEDIEKTMKLARTLSIAWFLAAIAAAPAAASVSVNVFGLKAPEEIDGFTLNNSTNFERIKPGEGYRLDYLQPGWKLDVFVYDLRRAAIPEDVKSAIVRAEFERSRADTFLAHPRGIYAQVYLRRNFTIEDTGKRTRFQCAAYHLTRDGAKPQDGYLCVTSWNNKFLKFRLTTLSDNGSEDVARKHVAGWIPVLWGSSARAQQIKKPQVRRRAPPRRSPPRRPPPCPPGFICR